MSDRRFQCTMCKWVFASTEKSIAGPSLVRNPIIMFGLNALVVSNLSHRSAIVCGFLPQFVSIFRYCSRRTTKTHKHTRPYKHNHSHTQHEWSIQLSWMRWVMCICKVLHKEHCTIDTLHTTWQIFRRYSVPHSTVCRFRWHNAFGFGAELLKLDRFGRNRFYYSASNMANECTYKNSFKFNSFIHFVWIFSVFRLPNGLHPAMQTND